MDTVNLPVNTSIFRDYDIRGIYPGELNEDTYFLIGRALAVYFKAKKIAVGRDTRLSSPQLFKALVKGITKQGVNVIDLGLISTEINYFVSGKFRFPANIIISASHNPPEFNGLKIVTKGVIPLHGSHGLPEIKALIIRQKFPLSQKIGKVSRLEVTDKWISHLLSCISTTALKPLKVVIDAGNGMGGISWNKLIDKLPVKIIPLYFDPDGSFPNHLPDPLAAENLKDLQKKVIKEKADLGFAVDGDADRLFVVDDKGKLISGSITTAMLSEHLLKKYGPNNILFSVTCSKIVPETITSNGGNPIRTRVGHSFIKSEMRKLNGLFAGEHSGHFYFRENYFADSSTLAGLLFLEYLSGKSRNLSSSRKSFEKYASSGEINYIVDDQKKIIDNLKSIYQKGKVDLIDGVTIDFGSWWFNVRSSKTESLVRLNVETDNDNLLRKKFNELEKNLLLFGGKRKQ